MTTPTSHDYIFIIGAQKSGTTFLASCLDALDDICVSDPKEPHFFSSNFEKGLPYFESLFKDKNARLRVDASTTYSFLRPADELDITDAPGLPEPVPQRLKEFAPTAKIIYVLRDPVSRMISALGHLARNDGALEQQISLAQEIEKNPMIALASRYSDQLDRYRSVFADEDILVVDFEQLKTDPVHVVNAVAKFVGSTAEFLPAHLDTAEQHRGFALPYWVQSLRGALNKIGVYRLVKGIMPNAVKRGLKKPLPRPEIVDKAEMQRIFEKEYDLISSVPKV